MMARRLGSSEFGDFVFGLSLAQILMLVAGVGSEELIARELARDPNRIHDLFLDVYRFKTILLSALWLVMWGIVALAGYRLQTQLAMLAIGAGVAVESNTRTINAVFGALERSHLIAVTLIAQRGLTAGFGVLALLLGAKLLIVSVVFLLGSVAGQVVARHALRRKVVKPRGRPDRSRWPAIVRAGLGFGLVGAGYMVLIRIDGTLLGLLIPGAEDNSQLGYYGAAYRLVEATMFISWGFSGAMLPWLARGQGGGLSPARGMAIAIKLLGVVLGALSAGFVLFAEPLVDLFYGDAYAGAVGPMRVIGAMALIYGLNSFLGAVLISRGIPLRYLRPLLSVIALNVVLSLLLIPRWQASGAAAAAIVSGVVLLFWVGLRVRAAVGDFNLAAAIGVPLLAAAAATAATLVIGSDRPLLVAPLAAVAYLGVVIPLELTVFRSDLAVYRRALGR